ncbi:MAG: hypothetical protein SGILL_000191, partial [Bacillariaceae sp.]
AAWIQHMIHMHSRSEGNNAVGASSGTGKRKRAASRGVKGIKRKRKDADEELVWSLETMLETNRKQQHQQHEAAARRKKKRAQRNSGNSSSGNNSNDAMRLTCGEEDAVAMEYLGQYHEGNVEAAKFMVMANLSGGQAIKMRKCEEKRWKKKRPKSPAVNTSGSWRSVYERVAFPSEESVLGQMQDDPIPKYTFDSNKNSTVQRKYSDASHGVDITIETDDLKGAWRAILACGKSIERQLHGELPGNRKPLLSTMLSFVGNSYGLPLPESCYGTNHVMVEEVANNMLFILENIQMAQEVQAKIRDKINNGSGEGVDSDGLLKFLDSESAAIPIRLPEVESLYDSRSVVTEWESRLATLLDTKDDGSGDEATLVQLEEVGHLRDEAKAHGYVSKAVVQLITRINKAHDLRDRILQWKESFARGGKGSLKILAALLKEMKRIKLGFAEASEIVEFDKMSNNWIDTANVAIRSKMAYSEIQALISTADKIPLDLSEFLEKLKTRAQSADQWLQALETVVPLREDKLEWLNNLHPSLYNGDQVYLHELSSEGNRIPVEVPEARILQVALDAKNWTAKSQKWIPSAEESKKAKLEDLRDHLDKATAFRARLPLSESERNQWSPEGEKEIAKIVDSADDWFEKVCSVLLQRLCFAVSKFVPSSYGEFIVGDNRRKGARKSISIHTLRLIDVEASQIYANIGPAANKMMKILVQAETWYSSYQSLLKRAGVIAAATDGGCSSTRQFVEISELEKSVEDAQSNIPIDIDEAMKVKEMMEAVDHWREQVSLIAPKRTKRHAMGSRLTLADLTQLIQDSTKLPIDTTEDVNRLQIQLSTIEAWRSQASTELESIVGGFHQLQTRVLSVYSEAGEFSIDFYSKSKDSQNEDMEDTGEAKSDTADDAAMHGSDSEDEEVLIGGSSGVEVLRQIKELQDGAKDISVSTVEGELADVLESVATWCIRSFKYLNAPRDIFDKRYYGAYDRFLSDGQALYKKSGIEKPDPEQDDLSKRMGQAWGKLVSDQLHRLLVLGAERDAFKKWCKEADVLLSDKKKTMTFEKLSSLAERSQTFPSATDLVSKVRGLFARVNKWATKTRDILESGEKISVLDAQELLEDGEKLKVHTQELKSLKSKLTTAENWLNKVGDCVSGQNPLGSEGINELIDEHESLLVSMPEEIEELKQAVVGYCLCRRPYEGFMIGCDHCDEWYHGPCVGVSESKAGRFEKYACIRCATKDWTCTRDLKKARQVDYQKIQRKYRKEKKDIEKFTATIADLEQHLAIVENAEKEVAAATDNPAPMNAATVNGAEGQKVAADGASIPPSGIVDAPPASATVAAEVPSSFAVPPSTSPVVMTEIPSVSKAAVPPAANTTSSLATGAPTVAVAIAASEEDSVKVESGAQPAQAPESAMVENGVPKAKVPNVAELLSKIDKAEILSKIEKNKLAIEQAQERLEVISAQSRDQKRLEAKENDHAMLLRRWVLRVRSLVLVPSDISRVEGAKPQFGVPLSRPMEDVIEDARLLGIADLPDTEKMLNFFKSMSWGLTALALIRRKPKISEINYLISTAEAEGMKLPDERALRTMKYMASRGHQCQLKIEKILAPKPGEIKSINVSSMEEIADGARELPLIIPERKALQAAIDDKGKRYCVCGGPNDGKQMLCCDKCKKWFHGACMNVTLSEADASESWLCSSCGGMEVNSSAASAAGTKDEAVIPKEPLQSDSSFVSPHAPDPKTLWPAFGLLGSKPAIEALGLECSSIPEEALSTQPLQQKQNNVAVQHIAAPMGVDHTGAISALCDQEARPSIVLQNGHMSAPVTYGQKVELSGVPPTNGSASVGGSAGKPEASAAPLQDLPRASVNTGSDAEPSSSMTVCKAVVPAAVETLPSEPAKTSSQMYVSSCAINDEKRTVESQQSVPISETSEINTEVVVERPALKQESEAQLKGSGPIPDTSKTLNGESTALTASASDEAKASIDSVGVVDAAAGMDIDASDPVGENKRYLEDTVPNPQSNVQSASRPPAAPEMHIDGTTNVTEVSAIQTHNEDSGPPPGETHAMEVDSPAVEQHQQQQQHAPSDAPPPCHESNFDNLAQAVTAEEAKA